MYGIIPVIGKSLHGIKDDPVNNKNREGKNEFSGGRGNIITATKNDNQEQLVWFKTDQEVGK
jgi:hypothetical protein